MITITIDPAKIEAEALQDIIDMLTKLLRRLEAPPPEEGE